MSIQAQAFTMTETNPAAIGYVRPQFRVVEGGLREHKAHMKTASRTKNDLDLKESLNQRKNAQQVVAFVPTVAPVRSCRTAIMLAAAALMVFVLSWGLSDILMAHANDAAFSQAACETIVVHQGDSLWTIADEHPVDGRTTEEVVRYIRESNDITDSCLYAGMELSVPQQVIG